MTQPPATLPEIWARIPDAHCRGLCQAACGPIGAGLAERELLWQATGVALPDPFDGPLVDRCPALTPEGRCGGYDVRPTLCRLYGVVPEMRCPHGCGPTFGMLTSDTGRDLLRQAIEATA